MDVLILRFPEPRQRLGASRKLIILQRPAGGEEVELEALEVGAGGPTLEETVRGQIETGHTRLVLDLINEKHLDSSDLAQILGASKQIVESGGELVIANPNSKIREIFRITKLDEVMKLFDSVAAAAEHLSGA